MHSLAQERSTQAKTFITKEKPLEAINAFQASLSITVDPLQRTTTIADLDEALLSLGHDEDANGLWSFELHRAHQDSMTLEPLIDSAIRAGRFTTALSRIESASKKISPEKSLFFEIKCRLALFETTKATSLIESDLTMPKLLVNKFRIQTLIIERRYKELLSLLSAGMEGRSVDLLRIRAQALVGTGRYDRVEQELSAHREFYQEHAWIDFELARNASTAKWRSLAVSRWGALVNNDEATDVHLSAFIDALINNLEIDRASSVLLEVQSRFKGSTISKLHSKILVANGEYDSAISLLREAISECDGTVPKRSSAMLWSELSTCELRRYTICGENEWLDRHFMSAEAATNLDRDYYPSRVKVIDALIRCGRRAEAIAEIDDLPENHRPETMRLAMWRKDVEKKNDEARKTWALRKRIHFIPQIENGKYAHLTRLDENAIPDPNGLTLYTVIKDERKRLKWFFDYYRALGVRSFVFVDNGSTDGSVEFLRDQPDVTLFSTQESYVGAFAGMVWVNFLKNTYSPAGWALYVDADEALVFDNCERRSVDDLIEVLEGRSEEAFTSFMLDMFTDETSSVSTGSQDTDFIAKYPFYSPKHFENPAPVCPYRNIRGGARVVFGTGEELTKTPLVKVGSGIDFLRSSHNITPARISEYSGALLHYKLIEGLESEAQAVLSDMQRSADCQLRYRKYLTEGSPQDLLAELYNDRCTYQGSEGLMANDLISRVEEFHAANR